MAVSAPAEKAQKPIFSIFDYQNDNKCEKMIGHSRMGDGAYNHELFLL